MLFSIMVVYTIGIWSRNIHCFFADKEEGSWMLKIDIILLLMQIPDGLLKILIIPTRSENLLTYRNVLKRLISNIYCIGYLMLTILGVNKMDYVCWWIFEGVLIVLLYLRAKKIYGTWQLLDSPMKISLKLQTWSLLSSWSPMQS